MDARADNFDAELHMDRTAKLPFKVGDLAEAKTFQLGYRGAWFRCKIRKLSIKKGSIKHLSEYYDYDTKSNWTKLYQVPRHVTQTGERCRELMLRPSYPPIYCESQMPVVGEISEVMVIVDNAWKVGDLVDWWCSDCWWSGRITELFGDGKGMLELKPPPLGEGDTYEIFLKDIRPTLDWSLERGWTVPTQDGSNGCACARIIEPLNQANKAGQETESGQTDEWKNANTSNLPKQGPENKLSDGAEDTQDMQTDAPLDYRAGSGLALNSTYTDTLEATIMDLEELVNKVKWIKKILEHGLSFSDSMRPVWEIVDQCPASSAPK